MLPSLLDIILRSASFLEGHGIESPRRQAEEVIADALGMRRLDLYLQFDRPLENDELSTLRLAILKRSKGEPPAYIRGKVEFGDSVFHVSPAVLIPRPETEILVEKICSYLQTIDLEGKTLWDVCTGSGCIGITLKKRFPQLKVILSDLSKDALAIAQKNADVEVELRQGDLFEPFKDEICDFFVCNPPYISQSCYEDLSQEIFREPKAALVSGKTGLEFYQRIASELKAYLTGKGWLEIGAGQGKSVKQIFENQGWECRYESDWSGHDRFFFV